MHHFFIFMRPSQKTPLRYDNVTPYRMELGPSLVLGYWSWCFCMGVFREVCAKLCQPTPAYASYPPSSPVFWLAAVRNGGRDAVTIFNF
jgi:hypothetical protein